VHDSELLTQMMSGAKKMLARDVPHVPAGKGAFSRRESMTCLEAGITTTAPGKHRKGGM